MSIPGTGRWHREKPEAGSAQPQVASAHLKRYAESKRDKQERPNYMVQIKRGPGKRSPEWMHDD